MRFNYKVWLSIPPLAIATLLGGHIIRRVGDVAAVQNCLNRDWETTFGPGNGSVPPPSLPPFVDSTVQNWLTKRYAGNPRGHDYGRGPDFADYRDNVYHERFRAVFRGKIRAVSIIDPRGFRGDLGTVLHRFPSLNSLTVHDLDDQVAPSEEQWKVFCQGLRSLPDLEELDLAGRAITDLAISPLAGHPNVHTVRLRWSSLTPESAKTFRTLPQLKTIYVNTATPPTGDDQARWSEALPGVILNSRQNEP